MTGRSSQPDPSHQPEPPHQPDPSHQPGSYQPPGAPLEQPATAPPGPAEQWRASDADRQAAAERLRVAVEEGRLDLVEYDRRLRATEAAATIAELDRVLADLPAPAEPVLVRLGELTVTRSAVFTPVGPIPLRGSQWTVQDQWLADRKTPTWAIVLSIVGFFLVCALSLLFLLAKETRFYGTVDVAVSNGHLHYVARIPVSDQWQVHHIYSQVNYVRSLTVP
jgi:hypothetical protein